MLKQNKKKVYEGTYYNDPFRIGAKATLHYFGGYMAYSTKDGDYLSAPSQMAPYKEYEREQVVTGYTDVMVKSRQAIPTGKKAPDGVTPTYEYEAEGTWEVRKEPITKQVLHDVTPAYIPFGHRVTIGDKVKGGGLGGRFSGTKTVEELNDLFIKVDGLYMPWAGSNITLQRV